MNERVRLHKYLDQRVPAQAVMTRGYRDYRWGNRMPNTLVVDVTINDDIEIDHLWLPLEEHYRRLLTPGEMFRFVGVVYEYPKRNGNQSISMKAVRVLR